MKPDKLLLILYLIIFVIFLTIIKMNWVILGLAGALPAFIAAALAFLNKVWVRKAVITYGAAIFILQIVFVSNFFFKFFESDNAIVMLLLLPLPIGSLILAIANAIIKRKK